MNRVSLPRLYALRAGYLLLVVGLGLTIWPGVIHHEKPWTLMQGVVHCMLAAMSALAILGLRYRCGMLPLLFSNWLEIDLADCRRAAPVVGPSDGRGRVGDRQRMPDRGSLPDRHSVAVCGRELSVGAR